MLTSYAICDIGLVRTENQDNLFLNGCIRESISDASVFRHGNTSDNHGLYAVADGMGGESHGGLASLITVQEMKNNVTHTDPKSLLQYLLERNNAICDLIKEENGVRIGSTFAGLCINKNTATITNIGDSRVYLMRGGILTQISKDHTAIRQRVESGIISEKAARTHPERHMLTQHLGIFPSEMIIEPYIERLEVHPHDIFLLCSDGLTDMVADDGILNLIENYSTIEEKAEALFAEALKNGGKDNITIMLVKVNSLENIGESPQIGHNFGVNPTNGLGSLSDNIQDKVRGFWNKLCGRHEDKRHLSSSESDVENTKGRSVKVQAVEVLDETLKIIQTGKYLVNGKETPLKLDKKQMSEAIVLTDKEVKDLIENLPYNSAVSMGDRCCFDVINADSFAAALNISKDYVFKANKSNGGKILVLNFANPVEPGGGVRRGAKAQEEDLCRKSTLLSSLESEDASEYYQYHKNHHFYLASDYMILSPSVEVFRDASGNLLEETVVVSVLTCAAPYIKNREHGLTSEELEMLIFHRIKGILQVAATYGYTYLVLGAWGCGAFGNDADMVARLFYKAFKLKAKSLFYRVEFAVLDNTEQNYNLNCFKKYFDYFYEDDG